MAEARRMGKSELFSHFAEPKTVVKARIAKQLKDTVLPKK
jgi:hypothetical protein